MRRKHPKDDVKAAWIPEGSQQVMFGGELIQHGERVIRNPRLNNDGTFSAEYWDAASGGWLPVRLDVAPSDHTRPSMHFDGER